MFIYSSDENDTQRTSNGAFTHSFSINTPLHLSSLLLMQLIWVGVMSSCYQLRQVPCSLFWGPLSCSQWPLASPSPTPSSSGKGVDSCVVSIWGPLDTECNHWMTSSQSKTAFPRRQVKQQNLSLSYNTVYTHINSHIHKCALSNLVKCIYPFKWNSVHCSKIKI